MKNIFIILIVLTSVTASGQLVNGWANRYNGTGNGNDYSQSIDLDRYGNVYVCGASVSNESTSDFLTIKYDQYGQVIWTKRYESNVKGFYYPIRISVDMSCNVYVAGSTSQGITTIKYDSSGNFKWKKDYNEAGLIEITFKAISLDSSGNVFVLGDLMDLPFVNNNGYILIKYDPDGNSMWMRKYVNEVGGFAESMTVDRMGNILVTGSMYFDNDDFLTIKYNSNGDTLWVRRFNTPGFYDHASAIAVDNSGNVYVTGEGGGSPFVYWMYKYLTLKYDVNGNLIWQRMYDGLGSDRDFAKAICTDESGNVYVTGESSGPGANTDYATVKYNSSGDSLWVKRYNGPGNSDDKANSIALDGSGNVYVTGSSEERTNSDFATIKYSPSGVPRWIMRYDGSAGNEDGAFALKTDLTGNIFVTGYSKGDSTDNDFLTIKYSSLLTTTSFTSTDIDKNYRLLQNFPNPFNPVTEISFEIPHGAFIKLQVYDALGKEILTLLNEYKESGSYSINFNGSNFTSGIYFYRLIADGYSLTKKMSLIK